MPRRPLAWRNSTAIMPKPFEHDLVLGEDGCWSGFDAGAGGGAIALRRISSNRRFLVERRLRRLGLLAHSLLTRWGPRERDQSECAGICRSQVRRCVATLPLPATRSRAMLGVAHFVQTLAHWFLWARTMLESRDCLGVILDACRNGD